MIWSQLLSAVFVTRTLWRAGPSLVRRTVLFDPDGSTRAWYEIEKLAALYCVKRAESASAALLPPPQAVKAQTAAMSEITSALGIVPLLPSVERMVHARSSGSRAASCASRAQRNPVFPVELSGVFEAVRAHDERAAG
jgi:hypothetical protein